MTEEELTADVPDFILKCPISMNWVDYRGETYFAMLNYDYSIERGKPMIDLCHCATTGMNGRVLRTVTYSRRITISKLDQTP